jgi:hypothetical protein
MHLHTQTHAEIMTSRPRHGEPSQLLLKTIKHTTNVETTIVH